MHYPVVSKDPGPEDLALGCPLKGDIKNQCRAEARTQKTEVCIQNNYHIASCLFYH